MLRIAMLSAVVSTFGSADAAEPPHVVFLAGDDEYRSEESLPMLAGLMQAHHGCKATCLFTVNKAGEIDPTVPDHIPGLEALKDADLLVLYMRFRRPPPEQLKAITDYVESGRPVAGFRTSTHAFQYQGGANQSMNNDWPAKVFGQRWITHHGHFGDGKEFLTSVSVVDERKDDPILRGVSPFEAYSWLYHVDGGGEKLFGDSKPLLLGKALKSNHAKRHDKYPPTNPVAWTKSYTSAGGKPARVFFTTLGHPYDFKQESMRRVAVNGLLWALGKEASIPAAGAKVDFTFPYETPNSGVGGFRKGRKPEDVNAMARGAGKGFDLKTIAGTWTYKEGWKDGEVVPRDRLGGDVVVDANAITLNSPGGKFVLAYRSEGSFGDAVKIDMEMKESPFGAGAKSKGLIGRSGDAWKLAYFPMGNDKHPTGFDSAAENGLHVFTLARK
jgi:type 1 glutamine amidotransferase